MTLIENDSPKVQYTGPFIKGQLLPLTFPYIATEDVKMIIDDTPAIFNVDYEIITEPNDEHPVAYPNSAYIKNDLPKAKQITLYRVTPLDQQAPFPQQSKFRSERVEQALDKLTMQQQEQEEQLSRCIIAPITLETFNGQLPAPAADQALKWNTEGTELENYDIIGEQEAFETEVNTRFEEQSTAIENRIGQFEEETNTQFSEFRTEINENLEAVLNAADKLDTLEQQVQAATDAANTALTSATKADEYAEEAFMSADQAEDALEEIKQVIQDAEDTIGELVQNCGLPMFSPQWSDHFYNDASFLRADTFSWHYADVYVTAYEEILKQYNNPESTEQTDGDIIYKLSPDGFRIALASEHDKVLERYLDGEKAWFYILDTENQRFKLPREKKTDGKYLYFYVGTYERPETEVNLGTVTDALNNKVDLDGGNYAGSGLEAVVKKRGSGGLKIGQIGIAPLGIDETLNLERYLNGQIIIQDQFKGFTKHLKRRVELYPSVACTEEEWQIEVTMSAFSQCGKFVIDNNAGTIRLPKVVNIQGLTDLSKLGEIVEAGLPDHKHRLAGNQGEGGSAITAYPDNPIKNTGLSGGSDYKYTLYAYTSGGEPTLGVTGSASIMNPSYGTSNTVQQEQIQYPYFIQVATGAETEDNIINEIELNNPYSLLDYKYSEYELNNLSWLRSNGQWNYKSVYPAVYELLLKIYNGAETKAGVSVKLSTETFTDYDFVLNTAEETFRLPLKTKVTPVRENSPVIGNGMALGLTTGGANAGTYTANNYNVQLATNYYGSTTGSGVGSGLSSAGSAVVGVTGDPTKSGIELYNDISDLYLYFYVGETVQNANLINAGRIEEKVVSLIPNNSSIIASYGMPDYSAEVSKSIAVDYIEATNGFLVIDYTNTSTYSEFKITINGTTFNFYQGYSGTDYNHCNVGFIPIPKNTTYKITVGTNIRVRYFPCIGG